MVEKTPRLGLNKYEQGDTDWDHSDTVEAVDENAIEKGLIADRPHEGEYDDELYYAIDQKILWRWDLVNEDWKVIAGLGTSESPVPGAAHFNSVRTAETHAANQLDIPVYDADTDAPTETHYFNVSHKVLKYKDTSGVVHVGSADVTVIYPDEGTAGINDAIEENSHIQLVPGVYEGGQVVIDVNNVIIEGAGHAGYDNAATTLIRATADESPIAINPNGVSSTSGIVLRDFGIDGNKANYNSGSGIYLGGWVSQCKFTDLSIYDTETHAINSQGDWNNWVQNCIIRSPGTETTTGHGIYLGTAKASNPSHWKLIGNDITSLDYEMTDCIHVGASACLRIHNNELDEPGRDTIRIGTENTNTSALSVIGNYSESPNDLSKSFLTIFAAKSALVAGNRAQGGENSGYGINLVGGQSINIMGNDLYGYDEGDVHVSEDAGASFGQNSFEQTPDINADVHHDRAVMETGYSTDLRATLGTNTRIRAWNGGAMDLMNSDEAKVLSLHGDKSIRFNGNPLRDAETKTLTADPTTDTPAGAMVFNIDGTDYEIPFYEVNK